VQHVKGGGIFIGAVGVSFFQFASAGFCLIFCFSLLAGNKRRYMTEKIHGASIGY